MNEKGASMHRFTLLALACLMPSLAQANTYTCNVLQHWRNAAINGEFLPPDIGVSDTHNVITLNLLTGDIQNGDHPVTKGRPVHVAGANNVGILSGDPHELTIHTIFPHISLPDGGALGSILRINDNMYMPKGTLMTRLSCKPA